MKTITAIQPEAMPGVAPVSSKTKKGQGFDAWLSAMFAGLGQGFSLQRMPENAKGKIPADSSRALAPAPDHAPKALKKPAESKLPDPKSLPGSTLAFAPDHAPKALKKPVESKLPDPQGTAQPVNEPKPPLTGPLKPKALQAQPIDLEKKKNQVDPLDAEHSAPPQKATAFQQAVRDPREKEKSIRVRAEEPKDGTETKVQGPDAKPLDPKQALREAMAGQAFDRKRPGDEHPGQPRQDSAANPAQLHAHKAGAASGAERADAASVVPASSLGQMNPLVEQAFQAIHQAVGSGQDKVTLKLHPPELGEMNVVLSLEDKVMHIELQVSNPSALQQLEREIGALEQRLLESGIQHGGIDLSQRDARQDPKDEGTTWGEAPLLPGSEKTRAPPRAQHVARETELDMIA